MPDSKIVVPVITIDGPSGAGKGTICRLIAKKTGYSLLDSGALYRLTALSAMRRNVDMNDAASVAVIARDLDVAFLPTAGGVSVTLDQQDVTVEVRMEQVGMNASLIAAIPAVRSALLDRQRGFAQMPGLVADGRDMGTVVFPLASVKIFLTASAEERARRRFLQLRQAGQNPNLTEILLDIQERDERDANRSVAPLKPANDALVLDSTHLGIEQVVEAILTQIRKSK